MYHSFRPHKNITPHRQRLLAILLLVVTLLSANDLQAQRRRNRSIFHAYPVVGATASQMRGDELRGFKKWGFTAGVGSTLSISDNDNWKLSLEADFSQRGAFNNTNDPYSLYDFTLNYVDIPLTLHFTDPIGGITIGAGLVYSRLVQQPHGEVVYLPNYFVPDDSDMSFLKNDFAAAIDLRFPIWKGLTFNLRYQHSLIPIKKQWSFTEYGQMFSGGSDTWSNDIYNSSVSVRIMYVFGEQKHYNKYNRKKKYKRRR